MDRMADPEEDDYFWFFGTIYVLLALIVFVPTVLLFIGFNIMFRTCIPLKNGLNLGYEAVFDLSKPYLQPIPVPRLANGTPLIREATWAIFITDTTLYGTTMSVTGGADFAWRADEGLVLWQDNPNLYDTLVAEAGHANWDFGTGSYGAGYLLNELLRRPGFRGHDCHTRLITW